MPNYSHGTKLTLASAEEPPYLNVGTDVSAKYKGAFCEAKITDVNKHVKLRVLFEGYNGSYLIEDSEVKAGSTLETGTKIEAKHPEKKQQTYLQATITKILDHSRYTVVFDDGDQCVLRRNSLCLKSGKHFAESETLDQLPLTNPEHFGNPVKVGAIEQLINNSTQASSKTQNQNHHLLNDKPKRKSSSSSSTINTNSSSTTNNTLNKDLKPNSIETNNNIRKRQQQHQQDNDNNNLKKIKKERSSGAPPSSSSSSTTTTTTTSIGTSSSSSTTTTTAAAPTTNNSTTTTSTTTNNSSSSTSTTGTTTSTTTPGRGRGAKGRKRRESIHNEPKSHTSELDEDSAASTSESGEAANVGVEADVKFDQIEVGVKLMVHYGKGKVQNVYEAKVNKIETNSLGKPKYFVHYTGWNNRYDEWITRNRILNVVSEKENGSKDGRLKPLQSETVAAASSSSTTTTTTSSATPQSPSTTANTTNSSSSKDKGREEKDKEKDISFKTRRARQAETNNSLTTPTTTTSTTTNNNNNTSTSQKTNEIDNKDDVRQQKTKKVKEAKVKKEKKKKLKKDDSGDTLEEEEEEPVTEPVRSPIKSKYVARKIFIEKSSSSISSKATTKTINSPSQINPKETERRRSKVTAEKQEVSLKAEVLSSDPIDADRDVDDEDDDDEMILEVNSLKTEKHDEEEQQQQHRHQQQQKQQLASEDPIGKKDDAETTLIIEDKVSPQSSSSFAPGGDEDKQDQLETNSKIDKLGVNGQQQSESKKKDKKNDEKERVIPKRRSNSDEEDDEDDEDDKEIVKEDIGKPIESTKERPSSNELRIEKTTESQQVEAKSLATEEAIKDSGKVIEVNNVLSMSSEEDDESLNKNIYGGVENNANEKRITNEQRITNNANLMEQINNELKRTSPTSRPIYKFCEEIDESDCDKKISILQERIMALRQTYISLKTELADLDRRRKRPRMERSSSDDNWMNSSQVFKDCYLHEADNPR